MTRSTLLHAAALLVLATLLCAPTAMAQSALDGAWSITSINATTADGPWEAENIQPSLYLFVDGHYSVTRVTGDEPRPLMPEDATRESLTPEQADSVWKRFTSNAGTYEVDGSSVTMKPFVALWPNFMASGSVTYGFSVEGDELTLTEKGDDWTATTKLKRLN